MSISRLFEAVGAPLANVRWSWGARRKSDGAVFLRVWQDLKTFDAHGAMFLVLSTNSDRDPNNVGAQERVRHVEQIRNGAPCFMVMCIARDVEAAPRQIRDFDDRDLFVGGGLIETPPGHELDPRTSARTRLYAQDGACWVRLAGRTSVESVCATA